MTSRQVWGALAIVVTIAAALVAVGDRPPQRIIKIAAIVANGETYADSIVVVEGQVLVRHDSPYIRYKLFEISDGSASIKVLAADSVPFTGDRVRVTGIVKTMNVLGIASLKPVIVEERRSRQ